jgi:hypothetical protein
MSGGVLNGQDANQDTFNVFMKENGDTGTVGIMDLKSPLPESGSDVLNTQKEINNLFTFLGALKNQLIGLIPTWTNNNGLNSTDNILERVNSLSGKFDQLLGHKHTGAAGDGPLIVASGIDGVPLRGYPVAGSDIVAPTGQDDDISDLMTGKNPSSGVSVKGVVVTAPYNKVPLFTLTGVNANDYIKDNLGNIVYGRITELAGVWTISYFVDIADVETPYALTAQQEADGIKWFYQELFNPIEDAPTYNELFFVQSDNATADVVDSTSTQRGLINTLAQSFSGLKTFLNGLSAGGNVITNVAAGVNPTDAANVSQLGDSSYESVLVFAPKVDGVVVDFEYLHEAILLSGDIVTINKLT